MPAKLRRLGLLDVSREAEVLDLCCGHGEALDALYAHGFRRLTGLDLQPPQAVAQDPRFSVKEADALATGLPARSYDWITCIHSLHHFACARNVHRFVVECWRLLRPGGRLAILDFPASLRIQLAFWYFRHPAWLLTPYQQYFGRIVQEEWPFLEGYLIQWPLVHDLLWNGPFAVERESATLFYFHLTLRKPL